MNKTELVKLIDSKVTSLREHRTNVANQLKDEPEIIAPLLSLVFDKDNPVSIKASWVLEFILKENLDLLTPHLNLFAENIAKVHFESVVRPCAKICEMLAKSYTSKKDSLIKEFLEKKHINNIVEAGFDWMISQHKVAVKAYTMTSLFLFGKQIDWVHNELKLILEQDIMYQSPAYKARGRITLERIKKFQAKNKK